MNQPSVLFVSKKREDPLAQDALAFIPQHFRDAQIVLGTRGDPLPESIRGWRGDYLVSYLSPWIIPQCVLDKARVAAINFHPGPPEYPGIGCYNFAIYDRVATYGVTCHRMAAAVDTGRISAVRRFPVFPSDDVLSLAKRSSAHLLLLFYEVMSVILCGNPLPESDETWQRRPYTTPEMYDLFRITPEMPEAEVERRVKAAQYPGWPGAFVELGGQRFYHAVDHGRR
jgi:methionyl-tRNA formyltransferase